MSKPNYRPDRLLRLAEHLESGKLGHQRFDFSTLNHTPGQTPRAECGTNGCAIGECPILFQDEGWDWTNDGKPYLKGVSQWFMGWRESAEVFFGISAEAASHLFIPRHQDPARYGSRQLKGNARRKTVAKHIRIFVERYRPEKSEE